MNRFGNWFISKIQTFADYKLYDYADPLLELAYFFRCFNRMENGKIPFTINHEVGKTMH